MQTAPDLFGLALDGPGQSTETGGSGATDALFHQRPDVLPGAESPRTGRRPGDGQPMGAGLEGFLQRG